MTGGIRKEMDSLGGVNTRHLATDSIIESTTWSFGSALKSSIGISSILHDRTCGPEGELERTDDKSRYGYSGIAQGSVGH
jgi:hypothetical protein